MTTAITALGPTATVAPTVAPATASLPAVRSGTFDAALQRATSAAGEPPTVGADASPSAPGLAGRRILDTALLALGRPAASPGPGTTGGSAFVAATYRRMGVALPESLADQTAMGVPVDSVASARSGDLVFTGDPAASAGIYAGMGRMVHAPADGGPVRLIPIPPGAVSIRRIVSEAPPVALPASTALGGLGVGATSVVGHPAVGSAAPAGSAGGPGKGLDGVPYRELFERAATASGVDAALLAAVAKVESGFDPRAVSRAGAQGLMQFMPGTSAQMGVDPWDPASAIAGAARYLDQGLDRFGSVELALAAYNAGPVAVQLHGGIPPFAETQNYVRKVLEAREHYRR